MQCDNSMDTSCIIIPSKESGLLPVSLDNRLLKCHSNYSYKQYNSFIRCNNAQRFGMPFTSETKGPIKHPVIIYFGKEGQNKVKNIALLRTRYNIIHKVTHRLTSIDSKD